MGEFSPNLDRPDLTGEYQITGDSPADHDLTIAHAHFEQGNEATPLIPYIVAHESRGRHDAQLPPEAAHSSGDIPVSADKSEVSDGSCAEEDAEPPYDSQSGHENNQDPPEPPTQGDCPAGAGEEDGRPSEIEAMMSGTVKVDTTDEGIIVVEMSADTTTSLPGGMQARHDSLRIAINAEGNIIEPGDPAPKKESMLDFRQPFGP